MTNLLVWAPDIADVAAAALLDDGHEGHAYEVNGPETLTRAEQAQVIGNAIGRNVRFVELTRDHARDQWIADGMDPGLADWLLGDADQR
jgi:uncharacterized protein YbjT (DUF2867 family)